MFSEENNIDNIDQLVTRVKEYFTLQKEYVTLEVVEKLTIIISSLLMIFIITILGLMTVFYLLVSFAYVLEPHVGGLHVSYAIIAGITLVFILIAYFLRERIFIKPMVSFLADLFFKPKKRK